MKNVLLLFGILLLIVSISGCTQTKQMQKEVSEFETPFISEAGENPLESPTSLCIDLCNEKKSTGMDLSSGPCLSNEIAKNWVCDVAHDPRQAADNDPTNQCTAYANGTAKHYVEVDTSCYLIKTR